MDATLEYTITGEGKRYKVTVKSDLGKKEGLFEVDSSVKSKMYEIEKAIEEQRPLDKEFVEKLGIKLFEMLFSDSKDLLHRYMDQFDYLNIVLNMKDPFLHEIPWELCYDPEYNRYIGADPHCSLVRRDQKSTQRFGKIDYPLKVLVIVSSPMDLEEKGKYPLNLDEIIKLMEPLTLLVDKGLVKLDFLERASVKHIQDKLKEGYHIVHFVGHGLYNREEEKGYLLIEDKNRGTKKLEGQKVAQLFGVNSPQLMILSSCESSPLIPFLLTRKVPAVLAMQYTVLLRVATQFVKQFYSLLVKGDSVLQAVSSARTAVLLEEGEGNTGWFTPVLYMRSEDVLKINAESELAKPEPKVVERVDMVKDLIGVENFVGRRKDLWLIEKALFEENLKLVVITGIGGIGKCALASKFVRKYKNRYNAVFATKILDPKIGAEEILGLLDHFLMENGDKRLHDVIGEVDLNVKLERLNYCLKEKYLIVLDNFELLLKDEKIADNSVEAFLQAVLSGDHSSNVIITSRYSFTFRDEKAGGLIRYVDLKELGLQAATQLLERLGIEDREMRKWIHEKIGGNPQFLEFFVKLAKTRSVEGLLRDVTPVREKIGAWLLNELVEELTEEEHTVLTKLSVFRVKVERSVFDVLNVSGKVLDKLVYSSLVKIDHEHCFMHQGVKVYVNALLSKGEKVKAHTEAVKYYEALFSRWKGDLPDILEFHYHLVESRQYEKAGEVAIDLVEPFIRQGYWRKLMMLLIKTVNTTEGKTKAAGLHSLGIVHQSLGEYELAKKQYRESLDIAERLKDKQGIAASLHHLGMIHHLRGEYKEAEKLYRKSLDIAQHLKDAPGIARSLHQLGMIYEEQREYKKAEKLYRESLDISQRLEDAPGIAASLHHLGWIHHLRGEYEEAEILYRESLDIAKILGDKQGIAASLHNLGMLFEKWKEYEEAEKLYRESLDIAKILGDKQGIARSLHHLGMIHQAREEYEEAEKLYRESLDVKIHLEDEQGIARSLHHLGMIHQLRGKIQPCKDPLTKMFFGRFGYKVVYFWIACNAMFFLASLYHGTLTKIDLSFESSVEPTTLPLLKDRSFYIFFILGSCGIVLINQVLKKGPGMFASLRNNKVLLSKAKMKSSVEVYDRRLREVEKKINSKRSYIYGTMYVLFSVFYTFIDYYRIPITESRTIVFCDIRIFPLSGIVVYITYAILYFLLVVVIYKSALLIHFLKKLSSAFDFQVKPLHRDRCGGLKPVGDFCIAIDYIIFIFFIVFIAFYAFPPSEGPMLSLYISLPLYLFFATFFVFYPLRPIHNSMKKQKYSFLLRLNELDPNYRETLTEIIDKGIDVSSRTLKKMGSIDKVYEQARKMRIWPFKVSGLIWFLAAVFVPVSGVMTITFDFNEVIWIFTAVFIPVLYLFVNAHEKKLTIKTR